MKVLQLLGAVAGYAVLWLGNLVYRVKTGVDGIGQGDFKLCAALGAWLGLDMVLFVVLDASCASAGWSLAMRKNQSIPYAFGPWLCAAGFLALMIRLHSEIRLGVY